MRPEQFNFELVRDRLDALGPATDATERHAFWVLDRRLGVARAPHGRVEVFLVGPPLDVHSQTLRRQVEHNAWEIVEAETRLNATRIIFPDAPHFLAITSLVVVELLRAGIANGDVQAAFNVVEPILELALRRGVLTEESIIGLVGELLVLEQALAAVAETPELRSSVLDMWQGHAGARDFRIGGASLEIKTTRLLSSSHHIPSLGQIEPELREDGSLERLWLLSMSIIATQDAGFTMPELVDRILGVLADPALPVAQRSPLQLRFLRDVANYGAGAGEGYDHVTMAQWGVYRRRFDFGFVPRMYLLNDPGLRLLRRSDLVGTFVNPDDIQYRIDLPEQLNDGNPARNWQRELVQLVRSSLSLV